MNLKTLHKGASVLAVLAILATSLGSPISAGATAVPEPDSCNEEHTYTFSSKDWGDYGDDSSKPANIDYINTNEIGEPNNLSVSADAGFAITKVEVSVDDDGNPGFVQIATGPITNQNPAGTEINVTKVTVKKICASVTINQAVAQVDPTGTSPINFTVVFSESVTGFATGDVTLAGTAGATTGTVTGSGTTYNVAVTGMTGPGTVIATVGANKATGAGGHGNTPSTSTDNTVTYAPDTTKPSVTVEQAAGQVDPTGVSPILFTVQFSEVVTDFDDVSDVVLSGTAGATTVVITPVDQDTYTLSVSGMTNTGTVIASVGADKAIDGAGNGNTPSTSVDNTVTYQIDVCTNLDGVQTSLPEGYGFASAGICTPNNATLSATKIVCPTEASLPNWGAGNVVGEITEDTAADFLETHKECEMVRDWNFQWATDAAGDPDDNVNLLGAPWATFSGSVSVPAGINLRVREALPEGYLPFTGQNTNLPVSAELYCGSDVLHYDNWEHINNTQGGATYHCVAFNVELEEQFAGCELEKELLVNGGFEFPLVTNAAKWDIFGSNTLGLGWSALWTAPIGAPDVANIEIQKDGLNGWTTPFGDQWAELDSDWQGPGGGSGEAGGIIISQTIDTEAGAQYTLSFDFAARPSTAAAQNEIDVLIDGVVVDTVGPTTDSWTPYSYVFTATDADAVVALRYEGTPNDSLGAFVDNASATCTEDACVPKTYEEVYVSDSTTTSDGNASVELSFIHSAWTASIPGASWIWSEEPLTDPVGETNEEFVKSFTIVGEPQGASLMIATDNSFEVYVNGGDAPVCASAAENNHALGTQATCEIEAEDLVEGNNSILFKVKNWAQQGGTQQSNPAGLLYKLTVTSEDSCDGPDEDTGTLVIKKITEGGDDTFWFDITPQYDDKVLYKVLDDDGGDASVTTEEGMGMTTKYLEEGWYSLTELVPSGWELEDVYCTYEGVESEGVEGEYGYEIYIEEDETVTCTFYNEKEYVYEDEPTDMCSNLDDVQEEVPDGMEQDAQGNCVSVSRSGNHRGGGNGGGEVLGASACGPLLTKYLHIGWDNDSEEVKKLQGFLNDHLGLSLELDGFFGDPTFLAVQAFQMMHWQDVLQPWFGRPDSGIEGENDPTGYVYQTTRWQINNIWCPGSEAFPETLI